MERLPTSRNTGMFVPFILADVQRDAALTAKNCFRSGNEMVPQRLSECEKCRKWLVFGNELIL